MTRRRKITEEQITQMIELYQTGASIADVSRDMNISPSTVASNLTKRIQLRAPGHRRATSYLTGPDGQPKNGQGRNTRGICAVREVDTLPCPALEGGTHALTNDTRGRTSCRYCGRSWADLDAEERKAL